MDSVGECLKVRVLTADNQSRVRHSPVMKRNEVAPIQRHDRPPIPGRVGKDLVIADSASGIPSLRGRQGVMAMPSQALDGRHWKVLVGVNRRQGLGSLVFADIALDLISVGVRVGPRVREI